MPGDLRLFYFFLPAYPIPVVRQLLDVMDETEEFPLRIDLLLTTQREAIESLVVAQIAEHRFHGGKALSVAFSSLFAVDALAHALGVGLRCLAREYGNLACFGRIRFAQTLLSEITVGAR